MCQYEMEELIPIVAKLTEKYTSKESSSISYEKANQLMEAVLYCIHENNQTKEQEGSTELFDRSHKLSAIEAYNRGYDLVLDKVHKTTELFNDIIMDFHSYRNENYYDTVVKGIPGFLKYYDAKFQPQNHILTMDYPTLVQLDDQCGVDAIYQFLVYIQLEQTFLNRFPENYVIEVLAAFHNDYEKLFMNICNIVLRNVIGCMITGKGIMEKGYSDSDYDKIREFVQSGNQREIEKKLSKLLQILIKEGYDNNGLLLEYLQADITNFSFELQNVVTNNCLEVIFQR